MPRFSGGVHQFPLADARIIYMVVPTKNRPVLPLGVAAWAQRSQLGLSCSTQGGTKRRLAVLGSRPTLTRVTSATLLDGAGWALTAETHSVVGRLVARL